MTRFSQCPDTSIKYGASRRIFRNLAVALALTGAVCGCKQAVTNPSPHDDLKTTRPADKEATAPSYKIGVGDEVEVKYFFAPELNDLVLVRPDGKVSMMFAQDVQAAGRTPEELAADIKGRVSGRVRQPDLVVTVRSFGSQKVYVGGEVNKPGSVQLTGGERLMQVLSAAGWITPAGRKNEVVLLRCCVEGKQAAYMLNVEQIINGEDMTQNVLLAAGDQVMVPPSDAVAFDRWVDQYIRQALPWSNSIVVTNQSNFFK